MIEIFLLSLVQGITEFLPISSSSHLIIFSNYTNFENQSLSIDPIVTVPWPDCSITQFPSQSLS